MEHCTGRLAAGTRTDKVSTRAAKAPRGKLILQRGRELVRGLSRLEGRGLGFGHSPETPPPARAISQEASKQRTDDAGRSKRQSQHSHVRRAKMWLGAQSDGDEAASHGTAATNARHNAAQDQSGAVGRQGTYRVAELKRDDGGSKRAFERKVFILNGP